MAVIATAGCVTVEGMLARLYVTLSNSTSLAVMASSRSEEVTVARRPRAELWSAEQIAWS